MSYHVFFFKIIGFSVIDKIIDFRFFVKASPKRILATNPWTAELIIMSFNNLCRAVDESTYFF